MLLFGGLVWPLNMLCFVPEHVNTISLQPGLRNIKEKDQSVVQLQSTEIK